MNHCKCQIFYSVLLVLLFSAITVMVSAQSSLNYQWYINANVGLSQYFGDIQTENNHFSKLQNETDLGFGVRAGKYISPVFSAHFQFLNANLKGQKGENGIKFKSDLMEYQLGGTVNFSNLFFKNKERRISIYGVAGVGAIFFRSEARTHDGDLVNDCGYTTNGDRKKSKRESAFVFPLGAGLDIKLTDRLYLNLESVLRLTNTDKLDAMIKGSQMDAYYYSSLGLSYNFIAKKAKEVTEPPPEIIEIAEVPFANENVDIVYYIPRELNSFDEFEMKCEVHKGNIDGKAELVQILPIGFDVLDTVIDNARMEFKNYTLNLYWDELPEDSVFEISYTVKLDRIYGNLPLTSILYIDRTEKEYKFRTNVFINRAESEEELAKINEDEQIAEKELMPPEDKVEFRVQVRASGDKRIPLQRFANNYHIREEVKEDFDGSWYRYSVGVFADYFEAKDYRNKIVTENIINDAFVVAFFNGERLDSISQLIQLAPDFYPLKISAKERERGTVFRIQILALKDGRANISELKNKYNINREIHEEIYNNWSKYTIGDCGYLDEAKKLRLELIDKGLTGAFIVKFEKGERAADSDN